VHSYRNPLYAESLGRIALLIVTVGFAAFFVGRLAYPQRGAFGPYLAAHPGGRINRLRMLWYPLLVAMPLWCSRYSPYSAMSIRPEHSCGP